MSVSNHRRRRNRSDPLRSRHLADDMTGDALFHAHGNTSKTQMRKEEITLPPDEGLGEVRTLEHFLLFSVACELRTAAQETSPSKRSRFACRKRPFHLEHFSLCMICMRTRARPRCLPWGCRPRRGKKRVAGLKRGETLGGGGSGELPRPRGCCVAEEYEFI